MDALLTPEFRQEALSKAYIYAVASMAGYTTAVYEHDLDGVDIRIQAGGDVRPAIEVQAKATTRLGQPDAGGFFHFPLKVGNYNRLVITTQTPRVLVVLDMPSAEEEWARVSPDGLSLRRQAYWLDLKGCKRVDNRHTVTVHIPERNVFDLAGLQFLMERSRRGSIR